MQRPRLGLGEILCVCYYGRSGDTYYSKGSSETAEIGVWGSQPADF